MFRGGVAVYADSPGGITITPIDFKQVLEPGKKVSQEFSIYNQQNIPLKVTVSTQPIMAKNLEDGKNTVIYVQAPEDYQYGLPLKLNKKIFTIKPRTSQTLHFDTTVPDAQNGTYSEGIFLDIVGVNTEGGNIAIKSQYQFNVILTLGDSSTGLPYISPSDKDAFKIMNTQVLSADNTPTEWVTRFPISVKATVENQGFTFTTLNAQSKIMHSGKIVITSDEIQKNSFPKTVADVTIPLNKDNLSGLLLPGKYTIISDVRISDKVISNSNYFYYIPLIGIVLSSMLFFLILSIAIFILYGFYRKGKQHKQRKHAYVPEK